MPAAGAAGSFRFHHPVFLSSRFWQCVANRTGVRFPICPVPAYRALIPAVWKHTGSVIEFTLPFKWFRQWGADRFRKLGGPHSSCNGIPCRFQRIVFFLFLGVICLILHVGHLHKNDPSFRGTLCSTLGTDLRFHGCFSFQSPNHPMLSGQTHHRRTVPRTPAFCTGCR